MFAPTKKTAVPKAPKTPGPLAQKTGKAAGDLLRVTWPYAAALMIAGILAVAIGQSWPLLLTLGAVLGLGGLRLHEAWGWHRKGGRAAARARRKFQGPASWREKRAKLSARAIRKRAHVTHPGTENPHRLPAEELGVLIGTTVWRSR